MVQLRPRITLLKNQHSWFHFLNYSEVRASHSYSPTVSPSFRLLFCQKPNMKWFTPHSYLSLRNTHACTHTASRNQTPERKPTASGAVGPVSGWTPCCALDPNSLFFLTRKLDLYQESSIWTADSGLGRQSRLDKVESSSVLACPRFGHAWALTAKHSWHI